MSQNDKRAKIKKYTNIPFPKNIKKAKEPRITENKSYKIILIKQLAKMIMKIFLLNIIKKLKQTISYRLKLLENI